MGTSKRVVRLSCLLLISCFIAANCENNESQSCFCKLDGDVDECDCPIKDIDRFNNYILHPRMMDMLKKNYFRYFKVNLNKICQFWHDDMRCSVRDCLVKTCDEDDLPIQFRDTIKTIGQTFKTEDNSNCEQTNPLGHLNETISEENLKTFEEWRKYDDAQDNFCDPDDENLDKAQYVDLIINPERFTGYQGPHAHKIWNSIYKENCFSPVQKKPTTYADSQNDGGFECLEKRVFYRLVSGLHSSVNVHLCSMYLHKGVLNQPDIWGPSIEEFQKRFDPAFTYGEGPQRLKNLYFTYLIELRAIVKAAPYLEKEMFYTGNTDEDEETKLRVLDVLNTVKTFKHHFDESKLFKGDPKEMANLKEEFKLKFRNITKIMDCVGCDKCRLWGKLQTKALGTALKILFSGKSFGPETTINSDSKQQFHLSRSEIFALFNGFGRLSTSISEVENFRELMSKQNKKKSNNNSIPIKLEF